MFSPCTIRMWSSAHNMTTGFSRLLHIPPHILKVPQKYHSLLILLPFLCNSAAGSIPILWPFYRKQIFTICMLTFLVNKIFIALRISSVLFFLLQYSRVQLHGTCASFCVFFSMKGMLLTWNCTSRTLWNKKKNTHTAMYINNALIMVQGMVEWLYKLLKHCYSTFGILLL